MKTVDKAVEYAKANPAEAQVIMNVAGAVVGGIIGTVIRKKMHDAGMIKSFWLPCAIKKPGTYTQEVK